MERMEMVKKLYTQAQKMTIGMAAMVVAYGTMGYYLIHMGKETPPILYASIYPFVKYGTLVISILAVFVMGKLGERTLDAFPTTVPIAERPPQKLFVRTALMNAGGQLALLLGLLLIFLGKQALDFIPFAVVSLTGFAFAFPKKQQWVDWLGADF